jgi:dihydropteroate synthase
MGILNVTPDSFSDGGRHNALELAVSHGLILAGEGADIIDIGGESTRPGSQRVDAREQQRRVIDVIRQLRLQFDAMGPFGRRIAISVDTTLSPVAAAALEAGADMLNDISAGLDDPAMLTLAADRQVPIVLMHMQGQPATMQQNPQYADVVAEVIAHLQSRTAAAIAAGIPASQIIHDPGIGFGKTREHNLTLLAALDRFVALRHPVLLGTSRKRFMGSLCTTADGTLPSPRDLLGATCATTALGVARGVQIFRVHDVKPNRQAADVARAMMG